MTPGQPVLDRSGMPGGKAASRVSDGQGVRVAMRSGVCPVRRRRATASSRTVAADSDGGTNGCLHI